MNQMPFSILELALVAEGSTAADSFAHSLDLAKHAEDWGYNRFWLAEHHNMESVASSATTILIGYIAAGTSSIRVGSGGVMLPNHAPLIVAEQFGTLASIYPGRIDLGLGRAPGTDQVTSFAIRGGRAGMEFDFSTQINELAGYLSSQNAGSRVRAMPGEGLNIPIWILGSSTDSAWLAGKSGLPYAFASHFAPAQLMDAIKIYRQCFRPSPTLREPYVMPCINIILADTDEEAQRLATSFFQLFMGIVTGRRRKLPPPVDSMDGIWDAQQEALVKHMTTYSFVGSPTTVKNKLTAFLKATAANEIMVSMPIYEHAARLRSYELLSQVMAY